MSKQSEHVKKWRIVTKQRMIDAFGGKCGICGYNKCNDALEFHHIDPGKKEFGFGHIIAQPKAWDKIVVEIRKCVCLCSNCHREIHNGMVKIPGLIEIFNEKFADFYIEKRKEYYDDCPICGKEKIRQNRTCSLNCAARLAGKIDWSKIDLEELLKTKTRMEVAEMLDISKDGIAKRMKKIGIWNPTIKPEIVIKTEKRDRSEEADNRYIGLVELKNQGISNIQIGKMLGVSETAVRKRLKAIGYADLK